MPNKKTAVFIAVAVAAAAGIPIGLFIYGEYSRPDVNLGYLGGDIHQLAFFVADTRGFYADEGLRVKTYKFANGGFVMNAFESASQPLDMAYLGFAPAITHRFNVEGADVTVVAAVNVNGTALIVGKNSGINSVADLAGKKIAIPARNNMQDFILRMILDTDPDVEYDNLTTIVMPVTNMVAALSSGDIDGYVAWEPYAVLGTVGDNAPGKYLVNSSQVWPDHPCCVIAVKNEFLRNHPDIVIKVLKAHIRATEFILDPNNRDEVLDIAVDRLGISREVAEAAMGNVGYLYMPDKQKMTEFLDKLITFKTVSMDSPYIPDNITTPAEFIDYFVKTEYITTAASS